MTRRPALDTILDGTGVVLLAGLLTGLLDRLHPSAAPPAGAASAAAVLVAASAVAYRLGCGAPRRFNAADRVTLARGAITAVLAGHLAGPGLTPAQGAGAAALALLALVLDGVDGGIARRRGLASAFGARLDMEMDALLILVLCALLWRSGTVGPWVMLIGLMRYAFVAAQAFIPALTRPLPPSSRRRAVCVVQVAALPVGLLPGVPPAATAALAATALALLCYSFTVDVHWLLRQPAPRPPEQE